RYTKSTNKEQNVTPFYSNTVYSIPILDQLSIRQSTIPLATRRPVRSARAVHSIVDEDLRVSTHKSIIKTLGRQYSDATQFFVELVVNSWMWGEATRVEIKISDSGSHIEYEEWG